MQLGQRLIAMTIATFTGVRVNIIPRNTATNTHVIAASAEVLAGDLRYLADGDESDDYGDLYMGPCR